MSRTSPNRTIEGQLYQTPDPTTLDARRVVVAHNNGEIVAVESAGSAAAVALIDAGSGHVELGANQVMLPGLLDLHIHAPQWYQLGTALDLPVEEWLFEYTFPLESRFGDAHFARTVYTDLVATLLAHGTTTAVYFASTHSQATTVLAQACVDARQRAFVGRVAMDHPEGTPDWYRDVDARTGVAASARSIEEIRAVDAGHGLVAPIVTPRFLPACSDALLSGLGQLAADSAVRIQTHCSESDWHHGYAQERFAMSDAEALDHFGLLSDHTVLAHSNHLSASDMALVRSRGSVVAHCPFSNAYFANAVFPLRRALDAGVRVGMGTDVGAGIQPGILQQVNEAVTLSRVLQDGVDARRPAGERGDPGAAIDTVTAFWVATTGAAEALGVPVGLIEVGRRFDAIVVDLDRPGGVIRRFDDLDTDARLFEKTARLTTSADITSVYVDGELVSGLNPVS